MKALLFHEHGGLEKLRYEEFPTPEPGSGEVLLRVGASGLNHLDLWTLEGLPGVELPMPHIGGTDVAGTVERLGPGVKETEAVRVGARVVVNPSLYCGTCRFCLDGEVPLCDSYRILGEHRRGGLADKVVVPAANLHLLPAKVGFDEAAASSLSVQTAWRMLVTRARVKPGETVVVLGAGGGVSTAAIQIAKLAGARVIATTSTPAKMEKARELGADEVVDYAKENWSKAVWKLTAKQGADVVVDSVGAATFSDSVRACAKMGRIVTCGNTSGPNVSFDNRLVFWRQVAILGSTMGNLAEFRRSMDLVFSGRIRPVIDSTWALRDGVKAYERMKKGEQFGKIVVRP